MPKAHQEKTPEPADSDASETAPEDGPAPQPIPDTSETERNRQYVLYRLMKTSNLLTRPFFARFAEQYELSLTDWRVIMILAHLGEAAAHEICDSLGMHPMNVSRSVASLRKQGRVTEHRDPNNRRRKILTLTPEGWALYQKLLPQVKKISDFLFGEMSPLEVEFLNKLLALLITRLESVDPESPLLIEPSALAHDEKEPQAAGSGED